MSPLVSAGVQGWSAVNASSSGTMGPPGSSDSDKCTLPASEGRIWSRPLDWDPRSPATHLCSLNLISLLCICVLISKMGNSCIPYPLAVLWDLLEKEMATNSNILAWKIPRTEERGRLQSIESQRVGHN